MNKVKKILFFLFIFFCVNIINVNAIDVSSMICSLGNSDNCVKQVYNLSDAGAKKEVQIIVGAYHWKNIDKNAENVQFMRFFFNDGGVNNDRYNHRLRGPIGFMFPVDRSTETFPIAVCAFPKISSTGYLDDDIKISSAKQYIYFSKNDIQTAINNSWCSVNDVYYSRGGLESMGTTVAKCTNPTVVGNFKSDVDLSNRYVVTDFVQAGVNICNISVLDDSNQKKHVFTHNNTASDSCYSEAYQIKCTGNSCDVIKCDYKHSFSEGKTNSGKSCTYVNKNDSNDVVKLLFKTTGEEILKYKGQKVDPNDIKYDSKKYIDNNSCPSMVYYYKDVWHIEPSKAFLAFANNTLVSYRLSSVEGLTDESIREIDNLYNIDVSCDGIIGTEMLELIGNIFKWIQILAPIFVIIMGGVEFAGAILQDDKDALKKASTRFLKRLIIAVALFFIPMVLDYILNIFNEISTVNTSTCGIGR